MYPVKPRSSTMTTITNNPRSSSSPVLLLPKKKSMPYGRRGGSSNQYHSSSTGLTVNRCLWIFVLGFVLGSLTLHPVWTNSSSSEVAQEQPMDLVVVPVSPDRSLSTTTEASTANTRILLDEPGSMLRSTKTTEASSHHHHHHDHTKATRLRDRRHLHPSVLTTTTSHNNNKKDTALLPPQSSSLLRMGQALSRTPIGHLGPQKTSRHSLLYYDTLFYLSLQYGPEARSLLEVGCAADPFVQYLTWIPQRTCVAPYQVQYNGNNHGGSTRTTRRPATDATTVKASSYSSRNTQATSDMQFVQADFMQYHGTPHNVYNLKSPSSTAAATSQDDDLFDLLICSQVVEHVANPGAFLHKLVSTAKTSIVSVPYQWPDCGPNCHHISNNIDLNTIWSWTAPYNYAPQYYAIVDETLHPTMTSTTTATMTKRIVLVYHNPKVVTAKGSGVSHAPVLANHKPAALHSKTMTLHSGNGQDKEEFVEEEEGDDDDSTTEEEEDGEQGHKKNTAAASTASGMASIE